MRTQQPTVLVTYLTFTVQLSFTTNGVSMAAPLASCTEEKQGVVIRFLWTEGVTEAEIHRR
jgi:hypothetical protein